MPKLRLSPEAFLVTAWRQQSARQQSSRNVTCRLDMKIFLSSPCQGTPCAQIETNLLGTKYEVVLDPTVQPFAQHQATHSHTPLLTYDKLPSMQSMHSMRSASCDLDVPVVDLPSISNPHSGSADSSSAEADSEPSFPVSAAESRRIASCIAETNLEGDAQPADNQATVSSPSASSRFLGRFRSARSNNARQSAQSPFATMAEMSARDHQLGANHLPLGSTSPASPSFLARYQSAKDSFIASRSNSSAHYPPTSSTSPFASSSFPHRSQSAGEGNHSPLQGSCDEPRCSCQMVPTSVGGIQYKTRIRGFMRPRRSESESTSLFNCAIACLT